MHVQLEEVFRTDHTLDKSTLKCKMPYIQSLLKKDVNLLTTTLTPPLPVPYLRPRLLL